MQLLFTVAAAFPDRPGTVSRLNIHNWDSLVGTGKSDAVWVVAFIDPAEPLCRDIPQVLTDAAATSDALLNFGIVDVSTEQTLMFQFEVRMVPLIFILQQKSRILYKGKRSAAALIKAAVKRIPDRALKATEDWNSDGRDSVILFTNKTVTPPIWAAVSCVFQGRLRVGISADSAVHKAFKIEKTPTILFQNRTYRTVYSGENSFMELRKSIGEFLKGEYEEPFRFISDFFLPEEFTEECGNFSGFCVVHVDSDLDPKFKDVQQKFKDRKVKFFYGDEDLPYEFMEHGKVYVIQQHKGLGLALDSLNDLALTLSGLFDQGVKLVPLDTL
jgi:hypothetical protein